MSPHHLCLNCGYVDVHSYYNSGVSIDLWTSRYAELWPCRNRIQVSVIDYCSREITALAWTAGCRLLHGTVVVIVRACNSLAGPAVLQEYLGNHGKILNRVVALSPRQTINEFSTKLTWSLGPRRGSDPFWVRLIQKLNFLDSNYGCIF